ncbi:MAG: LEPR-XLL domain-containing protein [Clostridia bacterium]|nr:LEPR-XLL domain-containing protein [Clostridia bacterium]
MFRVLLDADLLLAAQILE